MKTNDIWAPGGEDKFSFRLCSAGKEHAKKLTFPQKQLVIAKYPVHLIRGGSVCIM